MFGRVREITGHVIERSQALMKNDGIYYQFIKIAADDGNIYHVGNVIVGPDNDMDVISGEDCTFYIKGFRNLGTGFFKRHVILASRGSRGVSLLKMRMFVLGFIFVLLASAILSPILYWIGYLTAWPLVAALFGQQAVWIAAVWPIVAALHVAWTYLSLVVNATALKARLVGVSGRSQTLPSGQVVKTL